MKKRIVIISVIILGAAIGIKQYASIQKKNQVTDLEKKMIAAHKNGNCDDAIRLANEILQIENISCRPHQVLSDCYYQSKQMDIALKHAELAISYLPKDQYLYYLRGRILLETGDMTGCSDITKTIQAKGSFLSSRNYNIDYMDTSRFMDVNYRDLLTMRIKYCEKSDPERAKIDREILKRGS